MDHTTQMRTLLEAVDVPKVDQPKKAYANTPGEQTLDSATQQNFGDDLHKKKAYQHPSRDGDNAMASKLHQYNLEEQRLKKAFKKFKLNEGSDDTWSTKKECSALLDQAIKNTGVLDSIITPEDFHTALGMMMDSSLIGQAETVTTFLMTEYTDHNGGTPRNWSAISEDLEEELQDIVDLKVDEALETAGDSTGESATLKALHQQGVGQNSADKVVATVFGPTEAYPAPWEARRDGGRYPIYSIRAANKAQVATWLNQTDANKIIAEIS